MRDEDADLRSRDAPSPHHGRLWPATDMAVQIPLFVVAEAAGAGSCEVLSTKPGQRRVVRYSMPDGRAVIGKSFADPERAQRLWDIHAALCSAGLSVPRLVGPRPTPTEHGSSLVTYEAADGALLESLLATATAPSLVARAGRWLAQLHDTRIAVERVFDLAVEMANIATWAREVGTLHPAVEQRAVKLADAVAARAKILELSATTVVHKDFHAGHVLIGVDVVVIDLDEVRLGDPSFDVGHFLAYLQLAAWRNAVIDERLGELSQAFSDGYVERGGTLSPYKVRWAQAYTFVKIARQLALGIGVAPCPTGTERGRQIELALTCGEVCVAVDHP